MDSKYLFYLLPCLVGMVIFTNHYARDTVGALERQIESGAGITPQQYSTLNAVFFLPNIIAPLFISYFLEIAGGPGKLFTITVAIAMVGHLLFALGAQISSLWLFYFGRLIAGIVYEIIDTIPINFMGPLYKAWWGLIVGLLNGFLRLGSVFTFLMNPYLYANYGVNTALWFSGFIAVIGTISAAGSYWCEKGLHVTTVYDTLPSSEMSPMHDPEDSNVTSTSNLFSAADSDRDGSMISPTKANSAITAKATTEGDGNNASQQLSLKYLPLPYVWRVKLAKILTKHLPLHRLPVQYYYFLFGSGCVYGAMVPFWFVGSKFMQLNYHMSVGKADSLMLLPEGAIVVIGPPLGYIIDKYKVSLPLKLFLLGLACCSLAISYILLAYGFAITQNSDGSYSHTAVISPYISMIGLGISYAFCNSLIWDSCLYVLPEEKALLSAGSGLLACFLNILPTIMPYIITACNERYPIADGESRSGMIVLCITAFCAALFVMLASRAKNVQGHDRSSSSNDDNNNSTGRANTPTNKAHHSPKPSSDDRGFREDHDDDKDGGVELSTVPQQSQQSDSELGTTVSSHDNTIHVSHRKHSNIKGVVNGGNDALQDISIISV